MKLEFSIRVFLLSFIQWKFLLLPFESMPLCASRSVVSNSLRPCGLYSLWNSPGQNTAVGSKQFPSPGDLPNPGIEPRSPALQADSLPVEAPGKPQASFFRISQNLSNFLATSFTL